MSDERRIGWVDRARGLGMIAILLFHTEVYYNGVEIIPYHFYTCNALITFFFVSGFLFKNPGKPFSLRHKLLSVVKWMIIPYFVFTTILAFPKAFVHDDAPLGEVMMRIVNGHASWFIAALIVAEVFFAIILRWSQGHRKKLFLLCALPYLLIAFVYSIMDNEFLRELNVWCWQNAFLMLIFLFLGYAYRNGWLRQNDSFRPYYLLLLVFLMIIIKYVEYQSNMLLTLEPIHITSFTMLLVDGIVSCQVIVGICKILPELRMIQWTGKHSLVYYFFCGAVPMGVAMVMQRCGVPYNGNYWLIILALILVYIISTVITSIVFKCMHTIYHYFHF